MPTASIIPLRRLPRGKNAFDYAVPAELVGSIKPGVFVRVPFGGGKIKGVVMEIDPRRGGQLSAPTKSVTLKDILDIDPSLSPLHPAQLHLLPWLADQTATAWGTAARLFAHPITDGRLHESVGTTLGLSLQHHDQHEVVSKILDGDKPILLTHETPIETLLPALLQPILASGGQALILTPLLYEAKQVEVLIGTGRDLSLPIARFEPTLPAAAYRQLVRGVHDGATPIVIGTRSSLFLPFKNLRLVILLRSDSEYYKENDQNPRYDSRAVALELARLADARCILASPAPRVEEVFASREGTLRHVHLKAADDVAPDIRLLNTNDDRTSGRKHVLSYLAEEEARKQLEEGKRVILFIGKKGSVSAVYCRDCTWRAKIGDPTTAAHAALPTVVQIPEHCPQCDGVRLSPVRNGATALLQDVRQLFPNTTVEVIEKDESAALRAALPQPQSQIIIATHALFAAPRPDKLGLVVAIDADLPLYAAGYRGAERAYQTLCRLAAWSAPAKPQFLICSRLPEQQLYLAFTQRQPTVFYSHELTIRKTLGLPPFQKVIRLLRKGKMGETSLAAAAVFEKLSRGGQLSTPTEQGWTLLPPTTMAMKAGKEQSEVMVYLPREESLERIISFLDDGWIVDGV